MNNFQTEAGLRKQEAEAANAKLKSVRKMIAKLLTSSNEVSDQFIISLYFHKPSLKGVHQGPSGGLVKKLWKSS